MSKRFQMVVAVHLLLIKNHQVLLSRRFNTGYADGQFSVPAGHVGENESCQEAMIREAHEEIGITILAQDLQFAHVMHRNEQRASIDFFFACSRWQGKPAIMEADKCDQLDWFAINQLPSNTIPYIHQAIDATTKEGFYSERGFSKINPE